MAYGIETKCLHLEHQGASCDRSGAMSFPIYQTATFAHEGLGSSTGYDYSRLQNPTREQLEKIVAHLEGGLESVAFSSGMAAIAAVLALFEPGDELIVDENLYGGTIRIFNTIAQKNHIKVTWLDFNQEDIDSHISQRTKGIYFETPTNPMMHVIDIPKVVAIAQKHNLLTIVDNTFLSPYFQNPLALGVSLVVHSGTKYLGGHHDALAGFVVTSNQHLVDQLRVISTTIGANLAPFDSWLIMRGIKTLAIRMEKTQKNTLKLAAWLKERKEVVKVIYPGLREHPGHETMKKQSRGFGAVLSFEVETRQVAERLLEKVKMIQFAESLGGTETLITYPITQTHAEVPPHLLAKSGINHRLLRLSVGIESMEDLIADLQQAFEGE
ncbi:MAG: trans-sulfuration enzyme family protein [Cellulosilyticaceae bacterium]